MHFSLVCIHKRFRGFVGKEVFEEKTWTMQAGVRVGESGYF